MSEVETGGGGDGSRCAECGTYLNEDADHEVTDGGAFCRTCFDHLTAQVQMALEAQGQEINYPMAVVGAVAGGVVGVLAWWGFTVLTNIAFGLIAVVIGFTVGKGTVMLSGGKRSRGLADPLGAGRHARLLLRQLHGQSHLHQPRAGRGGIGRRAAAGCPSPDLFVRAIGAGFGLMDLVFLAIVVWQAWKMPAPFALSSRE